MMLPSEALNRQFILSEDSDTEQSLDVQDKFQVITTHAVLVGNIGLLLPSEEVSELVENMPICRLPNTPSWFNGITSLRGNMIPVFDLHELFGVEKQELQSKLIIVGTAQSAAAFWIDEIPRMVMVTSDDTMNGSLPLPQLIKDHSRSFFLKDDQIWIDWHVKAFFTALGKLL